MTINKDINKDIKRQSYQQRQKAKKHFAGNHFHIILRLFENLQNFPFTTSETMCNYYL